MTVADDNLLYSEYFDLNSSLFHRDGYVLTGWNTRPNGTGDSYYANDSVNKLTAVNNGEAKLYAQWHKPDVIITFDSQGGSDVSSRSYTLSSDPENPTKYGSLTESTRTGYTFLGWYTEAENGTKIESDTPVTQTRKLYAHWAENPMITFKANGNGNAYFDNDTTKTEMTKYYKYGQNLGVLPTPYFGVCELDGWYTAETGGTKVTSNTPATATATYYAHWGYKPQFDSNGGVYTADTVSSIFPTYTVQSDKNYVIYKTSPDPETGAARPTLPQFKSTDGFQGWYFGGLNLTAALALADSVTIDLSSGDHVVAQWADKRNYYTFPSGSYSVELFENWQGSGRTMMKVTVNTPEGVTATGYNVFFKMKTTLSNILSNGVAQSNSVCFIDTTENQSPPQYKFNRIATGLDDKARPYFKELDSDYTAFANGNTKCNSPVAYTMGFTSALRTEGDFMFDDEIVGLNTGYAYDISYVNGTQPTKDLIFYDVIENSLTGAEYDWHGTFQSVDITGIDQLRDANDNNNAKVYCAPKVYYCITDNAITADDLNITKTDIWTTDEPSDTDKLRVKAICVDCRYNTNNKDFNLPDSSNTSGKSSSVIFHINMISPVSHPDNDVMTYNEAFVSGSTNDTIYNNSKLTKVRLHFLNPQFSKTSFPESGTDADHRTGVVNESTIEYSLSFTNPDEYVNINNIVVEDLLDSNLILTNTVKVKIGDEDPIPITKQNRVIDYVTATENGRAKFSATVGSLTPGEMITIIIPATVNTNVIGASIDNTAEITSVNGNPASIMSKTTYHQVTPMQAKIKKVDINKKGLAGATLEVYQQSAWNPETETFTEAPLTVTVGDHAPATSFTSTDDIVTFSLNQGDYILHEVSTPNNDLYKTAADIPFSIDVEGIHYVDGKQVSYVEMVDLPAYEIVFHTNQPEQAEGQSDQDDDTFKVFGPGDLNDNGGINHFYDIPEFAGDEYVFAGWYYKTGFAASDDFDADNTDTPVNFDEQKYPKSDPEIPQDYHLYAKWIEVGTVSKAEGDSNNYGSEPIRGFGLAGVQYRLPGYYDDNYSEETPGGLRFVTSLSENLLTEIKSLSGTDAEYGYVVATEDNINEFISPEHYNVKDPTKYKLQYQGTNVNGVDTTGEIRSAETDFRYFNNINCTKGTGKIAKDHRNFSNYRLYTLVVTYTDTTQQTKKLDARAYLRYTDANGKERVFYNDYKKNMYYGGCLCSYSQVVTMALSSTSAGE